MPRLFAIFTAAAAGLVLMTSARAMVRYEDTLPKITREAEVTGFLDYAPFGYMDHPEAKDRGRFHSLYLPMLEEIGKNSDLKFNYKTNKRDYETLVQMVRRGEIDILLGAYFDTELYKGIELVYPAVIINPVTVYMLPTRVDEVKETADLRKLKGVRCSKEYYTDFVNEQLKDFDLEVVDTPYEMFEHLFTGKADYIMVSQFYGMAEASKLGILHKISMAKQTLWPMPVFIGVSKLSKYRKLLVQKLTKYMEAPENQQKIKASLAQVIVDLQSTYQGVVSKEFGLDQQPPAKSGSEDIPNAAPSAAAPEEQAQEKSLSGLDLSGGEDKIQTK